MVGKDDTQKKFHVHESLITARSLFFRNALQGNWKEAQDRVVKLTKDDPEVFSLYLQGLYAGHLDPKDDTPADKAYVLRGGLFVLAERIRDVKTKNLVIEAIRTKSSVRDHPKAFLEMSTAIYNGTPGPCGARELLVDLMVQNRWKQGREREYEEFIDMLEGVPRRFLMDLVFGLVTQPDGHVRAFMRTDYGEEESEAVLNAPMKKEKNVS
jgi:hypothetical protein